MKDSDICALCGFHWSLHLDRALTAVVIDGRIVWDLPHVFVSVKEVDP